MSERENFLTSTPFALQNGTAHSTCRWDIVAAEDETVTLDITELGIPNPEDGAIGSLNHLEIRDGYDAIHLP